MLKKIEVGINKCRWLLTQYLQKLAALTADGPLFSLNNQQDALIIKIYFVIKLYMFRASTLPIIRSFLLYIRHW
jgi:hypothetical protein